MTTKRLLHFFSLSVFFHFVPSEQKKKKIIIIETDEHVPV